MPPIAEKLKADLICAMFTELVQLRMRVEGAARAQIEQDQAYLEIHRNRLDYGIAKKQEGPLGSGAMESTCRHQVRFKRAGQFWIQTGDEVLMGKETIRRTDARPSCLPTCCPSTLRIQICTPAVFGCIFLVDHETKKSKIPFVIPICEQLSANEMGFKIPLVEVCSCKQGSLAKTVIHPTQVAGGSGMAICKQLAASEWAVLGMGAGTGTRRQHNCGHILTFLPAACGMLNLTVVMIGNQTQANQ